MAKNYEQQKQELIKVRDEYKNSLSKDLSQIQDGLGGKGKLILLGVAGAAVTFVFAKGIQSIFFGKKSKKDTDRSEKKSDKLSFGDKIKEQAGLMLLSASKQLLTNFVERLNEAPKK